jgi:hypothetical protein
MSQSTVDALNNAAVQINIVGYALITVFGLFGNTVNIIIFLTKLKESVCSRYLVAFEIANQIDILVYYIPYIVQLAYGLNGTESNAPWCRLWNFIGHVTSIFPNMMLCFASIDRFLFTSRKVSLRQWSSSKVANRVIVCNLVFSLAICIPDLLYWYIDNTDEPHSYCSVTTTYVIYAAFIVVPIMTIPPVVILGVFGYKTVRNLQTVQPATAAVSQDSDSQRQRMNKQLARMIVIQTVFYFFEAIPFTVTFAYSLATATSQKTPMQLALENLFTALANVLNSSFDGVSFYIYYLSSTTYRLSVNKLLFHCRRRVVMVQLAIVGAPSVTTAAVGMLQAS